MIKVLPQQPKSAEEEGNGPSRQDQISEMAYYLAEKRGFAPGAEMADWLIAENLLPGAK